MEPVNDARVYSNRYQVTHLIARGGMALVYRAQDLLLSRPVALKILYPELSADPAFVERFRREAQAAANLSHPNIVPVFDWGQDSGTYFIVMELIDGQSLADVLRGGRTLTASRTAQLAAQVASALAYAHRQGMVHRDVKPGNILITADAQVKVTDFGIAQAVASEDHLAEEGLVMGTATYFSPEQAEGAAVDGRSDVYSLGVVMYEMLVGRPPYVGDTPLAVSSQHVNGTITPPTQLNGAIPADLESIVMMALAKSPTRRYSTADELRSDLLRFIDGQTVRANNQPGGAFYGDDATRAVGVVTAGERTQAVPRFSGPRTDVVRGATKARSRKSGFTWVVVLIVLAAAAGLGYFVFGSKNHTLSMPDLKGESITQASATLRSDGFAAPLTKFVNSTQPTGNVLSTDPKAGTKVSTSALITLTLSKGTSAVPVTVPSEIGKSLAVAEADLAAKGLGFTPKFVSATSTTTSGTSSTVAPLPNTVLDQSPVAGVSVLTGATVVLTILSPTSTFSVPQLSTDSVTQAAATLGQEGLTVSSKTASTCSNTITQGLVVSTLPVAGAQVESGASVELVTSSGYCNVVVRDVTTMTVQKAVNILTAQGLVPSETPADPATCTTTQVGTVQAQSTPGGSPLPYNSSIVLSVCDSSTETTTTPTTSTTLAG